MLVFENLKDLMMKLGDEQVCRQHVEDMRWGGEPFCPHCGATKPYKLKDGKTQMQRQDLQKGFYGNCGDDF